MYRFIQISKVKQRWDQQLKQTTANKKTQTAIKSFLVENAQIQADSQHISTRSSKNYTQYFLSY